MKRDFLAISDLQPNEILEIFHLAIELKAKLKRRESHKLLAGQSLAMIFQKPSTRTRVSFEVGIYQLGGQALYLGPNDIQIGKRESIGDVAQTISRYADMIMARLFGHDGAIELAKGASIPVINGLTDLLHPCQVMADMLTVFEKRGTFDDLKVVYIGDGNNVANSWINIAAKIPFQLIIAAPGGYDPDPEILQAARAANVGEIEIVRSPREAVRDAHVLYTDVWASMGQEDQAEGRKQVFKPYQVNQSLLQLADPECIVMHCLPAHRGEEITDEVIDGPQSVVFDEAENRMHVQKAIMVKLAEWASVS